MLKMRKSNQSSSIVVRWSYHAPDGGLMLTKYASKKYSSIHYNVYENIQYKLAELNKLAYLLFHFICEKMDESNNIVHTQSLRNQFIKHVKRNLNLDYKDDTVKKAFAKLVKVCLIINYNIKSDFTVNPRHVFKGFENERRELMQQLIKSCKENNTKKSNFREALGIESYEKKEEPKTPPKPKKQVAKLRIP
jgi:hypothetical protein